MICKWEKTKKGYKTGCYHEITVILRGGVYCPFCGGKISKSRTERARVHYRTNKGKYKQMRAKYYQENKEELLEKARERYRERVKA